MTGARPRWTGRSLDGEREWGVTALQAVEEMDAGPIWGSRTFPIDPTEPPRKSSLYSGPVADAAIELVHEIVVKAADPAFVPAPLDYRRPDVRGRLRPTMRQSDREFSWSDPTATIVRRIRAADGSPGVRTTLAGTAGVGVRRPPRSGAPRASRATSCAAATARCSSAPATATIWIGHVRRAGPAGAEAAGHHGAARSAGAAYRWRSPAADDTGTGRSATGAAARSAC